MNTFPLTKWHSLYHLSEGAEITQIDLPPYKATNDIFGVQTDRTLNLFNLQNNNVCGGKLKRQKKRSEEQNASSKKHTTMNRCLKKAELKYLYRMSKNLWDFSLYIPINGSHKLLLSCCSWLSTMELASLRRNGAKHKSRCSRRFSDNATRENHSSVCYTWKPGSPANGHRHLHQKDGLVCLSHEVDLQKIVQCRFALVFSSQWFQETLASNQLRVSLHSCKRVCAVSLMVESSSCTAADRSCALRLCWLILAQSLATVEHGRGAAALGWSATSGAGELSQVVERWLSVHGNYMRETQVTGLISLMFRSKQACLLISTSITFISVYTQRDGNHKEFNDAGSLRITLLILIYLRKK